MAYAGTFLLYYLATLWAYAFVFAEALSALLPIEGRVRGEQHDVACVTYRKCTFIFGAQPCLYRAEPRRADRVPDGHVGHEGCHCRADGGHRIAIGLWG